MVGFGRHLWAPFGFRRDYVALRLLQNNIVVNGRRRRRHEWKAFEECRLEDRYFDMAFSPSLVLH
jgi:hypothetical protein